MRRVRRTGVVHRGQFTGVVVAAAVRGIRVGLAGQLAGGVVAVRDGGRGRAGGVERVFTDLAVVGVAWKKVPATFLPPFLSPFPAFSNPFYKPSASIHRLDASPSTTFLLQIA